MSHLAGIRGVRDHHPAMTPRGQADALLVEELRRSREMLAEAQQLARIGSWEWDVTTGRVTWSDELFRLYGYAPQAFQPSYERLLEHVHPDDRASVEERTRHALEDHRAFEDVKRVRRIDGTEFLMRTQGEVLAGPDGEAMRMLGVCEDVTDRVRAEEAQALLAAIVRSSHDAIFTLRRDGRVSSWNPGAERLFGWTEEEAIGRRAVELVPAADPQEDLRLLASGLDPAEEWESLRVRRDGSTVPVSVVLSPVRDTSGDVVGISVVARDVTERRRLETQLRHLADHDGLTGLLNRRRFEEELEAAVAEARRYGDRGVLLVLDLDNFKHVNDTLGHAAGDELIRCVARTLRERLRSTDVLARIGGDEFAILLPRAGADDARRVAHDLISAVREAPDLVAGRGPRVTTSLGAVLVDAAADPGTLLASADAAMYAAKEAGRDRFTFVSPGEPGPRPGLDWHRRIVNALAADGFELHLQPILDLRTDRVTRYEALLRMTGDQGLTAPAAFLPVAERHGLIHDVDRWVVREAVRLLAEHPELELEVNLSGNSLDDPDVLRAVARELHGHGVAPGRLVLEITETATIANLSDARRLATALTDLGCRFAIDDFGAGFGSFAYLKHLPAAFLKIDGDFVHAPRSRTDELVIGAIVAMARGLGKATIAEFVGDAATLRMLREVGVDYAQGYHVGRPFPARELR
jgi:diguanylate cyclase (GGDEF)-like protein/PAS domain S-box-containing protein